MDTKRCSRCGEVKPILEFHPHNSAKDGYRSACKACYAEGKKRLQAVADGQHKICSVCGELKSFSEFNKSASSKDGYRSTCKLCEAAAAGWSYQPKEILPEGQKRCTKCQNIYPATTEWFYPVKRRRNGNGLQSTCKSCRIAQASEYVKRRADQDPDYYKKLYAANRDYHRENSKRWYQNNRERHRAYGKQWKEQNLEKVRAIERARYVNNRDEYTAKARQRRKDNNEAYRKYNQEWFARNPEKYASIRKAADTRRRARVRSLPYTFTSADWRVCLDYWGNKCAVCQMADDLHADHWIPLIDENCPGTVVENMICLCAKCNRTKHTTSPEKWIAEKLGTDVAKQKLVEIETYFEYVKSLKKEN